MIVEWPQLLPWIRPGTCYYVSGRKRFIYSNTFDPSRSDHHRQTGPRAGLASGSDSATISPTYATRRGVSRHARHAQDVGSDRACSRLERMRHGHMQ